MVCKLFIFLQNSPKISNLGVCFVHKEAGERADGLWRVLVVVINYMALMETAITKAYCRNCYSNAYCLLDDLVFLFLYLVLIYFYFLGLAVLF